MAIINPDYQKQIIALHGIERFISGGTKGLKKILPFLEEYNPTSVLDFGCSTGGLIKAINAEYPGIKTAGYDPGVEEYKELPNQVFDAVVSLDVIEHIEPGLLDNNLRELSNRIGRCAFFRIACYPSKKQLPDGRNCHLIVRPPDWWRQKILETMDVKIVSEKISNFDKTHKWPGIIGHIYDVVLEK